MLSNAKLLKGVKSQQRSALYHAADRSPFKRHRFLLEWPAFFNDPGDLSMQPMLNIALRAARSAGELIFRSIERLDVISVNEKDAGLRDRSRSRRRADHRRRAARPIRLTRSWARKAASSKAAARAPITSGIDPLDGTTNFIHGVPHFAVSIACKYKGRLEHAVVLDPVRQEEFTPAAVAAPPSTVAACASAAARAWKAPCSAPGSRSATTRSTISTTT